MATFRQWESLISPYMRGVPLPAIEDETRNACIDFMQRTSIDRRVKGDLTYEPDEPDCALPLVSQHTQVWRCINVWTSAGRVEPRTRPQLDDKYPDGWVGVTVDDPRLVWGWISLRPSVVRLVPALSIVATLRVEVAYQPRRRAPQVDDYIFDLYGEQIAWGAMARLMRHADTPYENLQLSSAYEMKFNDAIGRLSSRGGVGHNKPRLVSGQDDLT